MTNTDVKMHALVLIYHLQMERLLLLKVKNSQRHVALRMNVVLTQIHGTRTPCLLSAVPKDYKSVTSLLEIQSSKIFSKDVVELESTGVLTLMITVNQSLITDIVVILDSSGAKIKVLALT